VRADEKLTAFVELESAIRAANWNQVWQFMRLTLHILVSQSAFASAESRL
jgi:hypothetical protein